MSPGWPVARLGDLIDAKYGKALPEAKRTGGSVPVYGSNGEIGRHGSAMTVGPTIIIGRKGSSGKVNFSSVPCWPIDTTYYIDEGGPYSIEFLDWLLRSLGLTDLDRSTAIPGLNREQLYDIVVPVPSPREQERITQMLSGGTRLSSSASSHISSARGAIERFSQVVLSAACSGRLTADWRESHPDALTVAQAIDELKRTRRGRGRVQKEQPVELSIGELPDTYIISSVGECARVIEYGTSQRCGPDSGSDVPVLRMGNIQNGSLDLRDLKYCPLDNELERLFLDDGDVLFNRTNSPELVGKSAVFHGVEPASFASYLIRIRLAEEIALPDFVNYWINSASGRAWAQLAKTDGVSQSNINGSKLALMPIPLPPIAEQRVIVERVSAMLGVAERLLVRVENAKESLGNAASAVLAKALRGELIPR